jgi:hypothetical protein
MPKNQTLWHVNKAIQKNWNYAKTPSIVSRQTISTDQSMARHHKSESMYVMATGQVLAIILPNCQSSSYHSVFV